MCAAASATAGSGLAYDKARSAGHRQNKRKGAGGVGSPRFRKAICRKAAGRNPQPGKVTPAKRLRQSSASSGAIEPAGVARPMVPKAPAVASPPRPPAPVVAAATVASPPPRVFPLPPVAPLPPAASVAAAPEAIRWPRVVPAGAGDHAAIHQLLLSVFHGPPRDAFYASLDDPYYEPHNRLLIKRGTQIISHLQLTKRVMHFGPLRLAVDGVGWLGTLPEFRRHGLAGQLMRTAERVIERDGAVLGYLSTAIPRFFRPSGWAVCGRHSHARADCRELLAQLSARGFVAGEARDVGAAVAAGRVAGADAAV